MSSDLTKIFTSFDNLIKNTYIQYNECRIDEIDKCAQIDASNKKFRKLIKHLAGKSSGVFSDGPCYTNKNDPISMLYDKAFNATIYHYKNTTFEHLGNLFCTSNGFNDAEMIHAYLKLLTYLDRTKRIFTEQLYLFFKTGTEPIIMKYFDIKDALLMPELYQIIGERTTLTLQSKLKIFTELFVHRTEFPTNILTKCCYFSKNVLDVKHYLKFFIGRTCEIDTTIFSAIFTIHKLRGVDACSDIAKILVSSEDLLAIDEPNITIPEWTSEPTLDEKKQLFTKLRTYPRTKFSLNKRILMFRSIVKEQSLVPLIDQLCQEHLPNYFGLSKQHPISNGNAGQIPLLHIPIDKPDEIISDSDDDTYFSGDAGYLPTDLLEQINGEQINGEQIDEQISGEQIVYQHPWEY